MKNGLLAAILILLAPPLPAHDLRHRVGAAEAVVIELYYDGGEPFAYESYELYREGEDLPAQLGRTDARGRIVFLADQAKTWQLKTHSEDGHGLEARIEISSTGAVTLERGAFAERYPRLLAGVAVILGLFGLYQLFLKSKLANRRSRVQG